jgi:hypothetical protein
VAALALARGCCRPGTPARLLFLLSHLFRSPGLAATRSRSDRLLGIFARSEIRR